MDGYVRQLETLQEIREIAGGQSLDLPQICVVGDQSSGKSSLLKLLTGVDFPVRAGTCTKAAIVVESKKQEEDRYEIMEVEAKEYIECESSELSTKILECQDKMLKSGEGSKISNDEIKIKVGGKEKVDIIVVDLPGIINAGPGRDETRHLIEKYIKPEQTLIFLVSEAKTDAELIGADELAKKYDPDGSRTMKVLTKFDTFDSDATRKRAINWILENEHRELGAHAVIAAPDGKEEEYDANNETEKLKAKKLPDKRSGIEALKARLPPIYAKLIQSNLTNLREAIEKKVEEANVVLQSVGEVPIAGTTMINKCQVFLIAEMTRIQESLTPPMLEVQEKIHQKEEQISEAWTSKNFPPNIFKVPFFSGEKAFHICFSEITEWWRPIVEKYIASVDKIMDEAIDRIEHVSIPKALAHAITIAWKANNKKVIHNFHQVCQMELNKFNTFGTMNHYLTAEYQKEMLLPKETIKTFISSLTKQAIGAHLYVYETEKAVQEKLEAVIKAQAEEFGRKNLHDQQKLVVFNAVKAAYKVVKKTFTDLIMTATTIDVLEAVKCWINIDLNQNQNIKDAAKEDETTDIERKKALDTIDKMNMCLPKLDTIM